MPSYGIVYILSGGNYPADYFKVGKSTRTIENRISELNSETSNIGSFKSEGYVVVSDIDQVERRTHQILQAYRVSPRREFFEAPIDVIVCAIQQAAGEKLLGNHLPRIDNNHAHEKSFDEIVAETIERHSQPASENTQTAWLWELEKIEKSAKAFVENVKKSKHLSHLPIIDNIEDGKRDRRDLLNVFSNAAFCKQDYYKYIKEAGLAQREFQMHLFAVGFLGKIQITSSKTPKLHFERIDALNRSMDNVVFYYISYAIKWDTRHDEIPSGVICLCPAKPHWFWVEKTPFELKNLGRHCLKLYVDLSKKVHVDAMTRHIAKNIAFKKVPISDNVSTTIKKIDYDDLIGFRGHNIQELWDCWPRLKSAR
jgi:hypothetical protein